MDLYVAREWVAGLAKRYNRLVVTGGPKVGANKLMRGIPHEHADSFPHVERQKRVAAIRELVAGSDRWVLEGKLASQALAEGLEADMVVVVSNPPFRPLSPGSQRIRVSVHRWISMAEETNPAPYYRLHIKPYDQVPREA